MSKFTKEMVNDYADKLLIGLTDEENELVLKEFDIIEKQTGQPAIEVYEKALENIMPALEVKSRRVGGSNYQVPMEVKEDRRQTLALRWLVNYARLRSGKSMATKLAGEIIDASNGTGGACKKREDTHRMAEANKAFAHFRW